MNVVFYLKTCDTCKRILNQLPLPNDLIFREIKTQPIDEVELQLMYNLTGNYEILFNKKSQLYKNLNLKSRNLTENDFKTLLLEHYTYLNRPVFLLKDKIFIGNSLKNIQSLETFLTHEF